jgi:outer membrane protein assembly factor BamB
MPRPRLGATVTDTPGDGRPIPFPPPPVPPPGIGEDIERAVEEFFEAERPVPSALVAVRWPRTWRGRVAVWLVPVMVLSVLTAAAVRASLPKGGRSDLDRLFPSALGSTWIYATRNHGRDTGRNTVQVIGPALLSSASGVAVESRFDNYLGQGAPARFLRYEGVSGAQLLDYGSSSGGSFEETIPPQPLAELPFADGHSWSWRGKANGLTENVSVKLQGHETLSALGRDIGGCLDYLTLATVEIAGRPAEDRVEDWVCPDLGVVRTHEESPMLGIALDEDLIAFSSPFANEGPPVLGPAADEPGTAPGMDAAQTSAVPGARLELNRLAWSDARKERVQFPPVGRGDLVVVAEIDGSVSALDTLTGEVRWRVDVTRPVVQAPVIAGSLVLVHSADKVLWALDLQSGLARWTARLPDLLATAPVAAGDIVVAVGEDRRLRGLRLSDGRAVWQATLSEQVRARPARAMDEIVVGDEAGGLSAFALSNGARRWSVSMQRERAAGPVVAGDLVVAADRNATVYGFDIQSGRTRWSHALESTAQAEPAVTSNLVLLATVGGRLHALARTDGVERWTARLGGDATAVSAIGDQAVVLLPGARLGRLAIADGSGFASVALPRPTSEVNVEGDLPFSWVGGALVITLAVDLPWPAASLLAFPAPRSGDEEARLAHSGARLFGRERLIPRPAVNASMLQGDDVVFAGEDRTAWRVPPVGPPQPLLTSDDLVPFAIPAGDVILSQKGTDLVAVAGDGRVRWTFPMGPPFVVSLPAVSDRGIVVPTRGGIARVDAASGKPYWVHNVSGGVGGSTPLVLRGGDVVYAVGGLARLDGTTGQTRWAVPGIDAFGPVAEAGGVIVVAGVVGGGEAIVALDEETGAERWRAAFAPAAGVGPVAAGPFVVAVDREGKVRAFDPTTGRVAWARALRSPPDGTPVVDQGHLVLVETGHLESSYDRDHRITVLDPATGGFLGSMEPPGNGFDINGVGASNGTLLVPTQVGHPAVMLLKVGGADTGA